MRAVARVCMCVSRTLDRPCPHSRFPAPAGPRPRRQSSCRRAIAEAIAAEATRYQRETLTAMDRELNGMAAHMDLR